MAHAVLVLRHVAHVPIGSLEGALAAAGVPWRYVDLFAHVPAALPLDDAAGLVVLGGPMNANQAETYPFLQTELDWIRQAVELELPTLGICLGAQLMAKALGKPVYANRRKEIGWYNLELLPAAADDVLLAGSQPVETVFQWHGDTFDLPAEAVHLARTAVCPHQAFRVGRRAWAVQFHAEMTAALIHEWLAERGFDAELAALDYIDPRQIAALLPERLPAMQAFCRRLLGRFAAICRSGCDR